MNLFSPDIPLLVQARFAIVMAAPGVIFGLIVLAAGSGRWHWFWRGILLLGTCALEIPLGAPELVVAALACGVTVCLATGLLRTATGGLMRRLAAKPTDELSAHAWKFGIRELLMVMILLAGAAAILSWVIHADSFGSLWPGMEVWVFAIVLTGTIFLLPSAQKPLWRNVLFLILMFGIGGLYSTLALFAQGMQGELLAWVVSTESVSYLIVATQAVQAFVMVSVACCFIWRPQSVRWCFVRSACISLLLLPMLISAGWLYWFLARPYPRPPSQPYPGMDVAARIPGVLGDAVNDNVPFLEYDDVTADQVTTYADSRSDLLGEISLLLEQPCCRQPDYSRVPLDEFNSVTFGEIDSARQSARMYLALAATQEMEGEFDRAAFTQMDVIRLGHCTGKGGLLVDVLVGIAIQAMGTLDLREIRTDLSRDTCRRLAAELEAMDSYEETEEVIYERDRIWSIHNLGWTHRLYEAMSALMGVDLWNREAAQMAIHRRNTIQHLLMTELALLAYRHDTGSFPEKLDTLVPEYLSTVPTDPFGDGPLVYRGGEDDFTLYSVGPNCVDDGGALVTFGDCFDGKGDFFLDMYDLEE